MTPETDFPEQVRWLSRELGGLHCPVSILARVARHVTVPGAHPMKKGQPNGWPFLHDRSSCRLSQIVETLPVDL